MAQEHTCPAPHSLVYPLDDVLQSAAIALQYDFNDTSDAEFGSEAHLAQTRRNVLGNLVGKSQAERDALILARLDWSTTATVPMLTLTTTDHAWLFDVFLETLDRHDLHDHAAALRATRDAFPVWDTTARNRYEQWSDGRGQIRDALLDKALREQSHRFKSARPGLLQKAAVLLSDDPSFDDYMARRNNAPDDRKLYFMLDELAACVPVGHAFDPDPDALTRVPPTIADFYVIHMLMLESMNGGFHQYIFNSTGALAPDMIAALSRLGLPEHAQAAEKALAVFPAPYPRSTDDRRAIMRDFGQAQDNALYDATWIVDDGAIYDALQDLAQREGYWPR
ncbi:MAG: DUF4375 domain-containing protein [Roseovarius confluentis]|jgi:hypothetical protein